MKDALDEITELMLQRQEGKPVEESIIEGKFETFVQKYRMYFGSGNIGGAVDLVWDGVSLSVKRRNPDELSATERTRVSEMVAAMEAKERSEETEGGGGSTVGEGSKGEGGSTSTMREGSKGEGDTVEEESTEDGTTSLQSNSTGQ